MEPNYWKRMRTLKKKAHELATLCGVPVCVLCYDHDGNLDTWPEEKNEVKDIVMKYKEKQNTNWVESLEAKNMQNLDENNERKNNIKAVKEFETWDTRLDYLPEECLMDVMKTLEEKGKNVDEIMKMKETEKKRKRMVVLEGRVGQNTKDLIDLVGLHETSSCYSTDSDMEKDIGSCSNSSCSTVSERKLSCWTHSFSSGWADHERSSSS